jgi:hypothetical protein
MTTTATSNDDGNDELDSVAEIEKVAKGVSGDVAVGRRASRSGGGA